MSTKANEDGPSLCSSFETSIMVHTSQSTAPPAMITATHPADSTSDKGDRTSECAENIDILESRAVA